MWRGWLLMLDLAGILLAVSLSGLAGWQEPHKANFCLDFGLRSKWEPAKLSACPHAAVPCCPAPRLAHMMGKRRTDCVSPCSLTNPLPNPVPTDGRYAWLLMLTFLIFVFLKEFFGGVFSAFVPLLKMQPKSEGINYKCTILKSSSRNYEMLFLYNS